MVTQGVNWGLKRAWVIQLIALEPLAQGRVSCKYFLEIRYIGYRIGTPVSGPAHLVVASVLEDFKYKYYILIRFELCV